MNVSSRRGRVPLAAAGIAIALAAGAAALSQTGASASPRPAAHPLVSAAGHGKSGHAGWQGPLTFTPQAGTNLFYHYACPSGRIATDGGFTTSNTTVSLTDNAARTDITPQYSEWGWTFIWPSGAPSGTTMQFNVFCQ